MLTSTPQGVPVLEDRATVLRRFVLVIGLVLLVGVSMALLARSGSSDRLVGAGSTFAHPLIQRTAAVHQQRRADGGDWVPDSGSNIDYEPVGSMGGIQRLSDPEVDFAISDYALDPATARKNGYVQFPITLGGLASVYNLGHNAPRLDLRAQTLAGIYLGRITRWSDPEILQSNPGVTLPDLPILVIRRTDGSGSTLNLTNYLSAYSEAWRAVHGAEGFVRWPTNTGGVRGSSEMAEAVAQSTGAIGYLEAGQARRAGLAVANIENRAGRFVAPTDDAMHAASRLMPLLSATVSAAPEVSGDEYPLTTIAYAIMKRRNAASADNNRTLRFFSTLLEDRAVDAASLGYLPLPAAALTDVKALWAREFVPQT
jgi:phosphate transport system substrate-binding protein